MDVKNGQLVVAGSTDDTIINITSPIVDYPITAKITVVASPGGIQFSSGEDITADHYLVPEDTVFEITQFDTSRPLQFKATNAADTFFITF